MAELQKVEISRGLLTGKRLNGSAVTVPVQSAVVDAAVPVEPGITARLTQVKDRKYFRFETDKIGGVTAVIVDGSGAARRHRFFPHRLAQIRVGGQTYQTQTNQASGRLDLEVAIPGHGADLFHALALLRRSHPRGIPASGIVVTAKFADTAAQKQVRESARRGGQDPWSPAWHEGLGLVVGALTVSRLFHGEPKGRIGLAQGMGIQLPQAISRALAIDKLGVVWVSRIGVDAPYRGCGVGTALLDLVRTSIGATLPWQPRVIEVLQSVPRANATTASRFFTAAGYRLDRDTYTAPVRRIDQSGKPESNLTPQRSLYYWAAIG